MDRIIAEMKRRLDGYRDEMKKSDSITGCMTLAGRCAALEEMIEYIETLQKEFVGDDLVKVAEDYANKHSVLLGFDCDSEPIQTGTDIKNAVIYGARWHKQQMMKNIKEAHVIMTHITKESIVPSLSAVILDDSFKEGDKVKLVIMEKI